MSDHNESCVNCNRTSDQVPLLRLRYLGSEQWICPQCLPILIHKPEQIAALKGEWINKEIEHEGG